MNESNFRVIIVGAGPTGLYMAKALQLANIDFVVLERGPPTFLERGNHVLLWPHSMRLLHQIGLCEKIKRRSYKLSSKVDLLGNGRVIDQYSIWDMLEAKLVILSELQCMFSDLSSHGYPISPIQRCELVEILYESILHRERVVRTSAKVTKITSDESGVRVHLADGNIENGAVVIGADGAHGITKDYINESKSNVGTLAASFPVTSHYLSIYAEGPNLTGVISGIFYEARDTGRAIQIGTDGEVVRIILYKKLLEPTTIRKDYTEQQMEEFAATFFDMNAAPGITMRDIWPTMHKHSARMVNQWEGFAEHWHAGRVVLAGDAAMVTSSVNALGLNCGLHSMAILASELQRVVSISHMSPTPSALEGAFTRYQRFRGRELRRIYDFSRSTLRTVTWNSWYDWFLDRFLLRWIGSDYLMGKFTFPMVANGQVLSYIPFKSCEAKIPWRRWPEVLP